jgi:hypothetical protein
MDPIANLNEQREIAREIIRLTPSAGTVPQTLVNHGERLAELVLALDEWRQSGGFDPYAADAPSYDVRGRVTLDDGPTVEFFVDREHGYSQWGADTDDLGRTVDLMGAIEEAVREHWPE